MADKTPLDQFNTWLRKDTNSLAKMAHLLGYDETTAVKNWVKTGRVPATREKQLLEVLKYERKSARKI